MSLRRLVPIALMCVGGGSSALAQVGYPPDRSPFRDIAESMEATFYTGWFNARKDPAKVAPRSGPLVGVHYQWRMSGPANFTFDFARVESERRVLDPERDTTSRPACPSGGPDCKAVGVFRWPLYTTDIGLALSLSGARSWYGLVPQVRGGLGVVYDFHTKPDVGEFAFGTRFAFTWGAGIRWMPGRSGRIQVRGDLINRLYSVRYPITYYRGSDDGSSIFEADQNRSAWLNNPAFTIGLSYLFAR